MQFYRFALVVFTAALIPSNHIFSFNFFNASIKQMNGYICSAVIIDNKKQFANLDDR